MAELLCETCDFYRDEECYCDGLISDCKIDDTGKIIQCDDYKESK